MMLSTHMLIGGFLGLWSILMPQYLIISVLSGLIAATFPDLDLFLRHRRSFHRPYEFLILSILAGILVFLYPQVETVVLFSGLLSMTAHAFSEILSTGKTMRPEKEPDDRAVYNHLKGEWIEPRRYVTFGESRDLVLTVVAGLILINALGNRLRLIISAIILFGIIHFLVLDIAEKLISDKHKTFSGFLQKKLDLGPES